MGIGNFCKRHWHAAGPNGRRKAKSPNEADRKHVGPPERKGKRARHDRSAEAEAEGIDQGTKDEKEFRDHVARLFLKNKFSAKETVSLVNKASRAGAKGVEDLRVKEQTGKRMGNTHRDLMRRLLRK